jgi:hypothetical protein
LPDGIFSHKNTNLGKFWRVLQWKMLVCFMAIWNILRSFGIPISCSLVFLVVWYMFGTTVYFLVYFTVLGKVKSGKPCLKERVCRFQFIETFVSAFLRPHIVVFRELF